MQFHQFAIASNHILYLKFAYAAVEISIILYKYQMYAQNMLAIVYDHIVANLCDTTKKKKKNYFYIHFILIKINLKNTSTFVYIQIFSKKLLVVIYILYYWMNNFDTFIHNNVSLYSLQSKQCGRKSKPCDEMNESKQM